MSLPPLNALRAFESAARHLSFAKAARELSVTPAALSHQVRALEEILGVKLFHRLTRAVALTDAGAILYPGLNAGFTQLREAVARLERVQDDRVLVVSVGPAFTAKWLLPRLHRFMERHPTIDARISANLARSDFRTDGVDAAIRYGRMDPSDLVTYPLLTDAVAPLCSPRFREEQGLRSPADLAGRTLIHDDSLAAIPQFANVLPTWTQWLAAAAQTEEAAGRGDVAASLRGIDPTRGLRFNLADHAINAASEGAGIVLARTTLANGDVAAGRLVAPFDLVLPVEGLIFYLVYPKENAERASVQAFRDWILEEADAPRVDGDAILAGPNA